MERKSTPTGEVITLESRQELTVARAALANFTHSPLSLLRRRAYIRLALNIDAERSDRYREDSDEPLPLTIRDSKLCIRALEYVAAKEDAGLIPRGAQTGYSALLAESKHV